MKLTKEHIGKIVQIKGGWDTHGKPFKLIDVGWSHIWIEDENGKRDSMITNHDFEIVDLEKIPSNIIFQKFTDSINRGGYAQAIPVGDDTKSIRLYLKCLVGYLDDLAAEK